MAPGAIDGTDDLCVTLQDVAFIAGEHGPAPVHRAAGQDGATWGV